MEYILILNLETLPSLFYNIVGYSIDIDNNVYTKEALVYIHCINHTETNNSQPTLVHVPHTSHGITDHHPSPLHAGDHGLAVAVFVFRDDSWLVVLPQILTASFGVVPWGVRTVV